MRVRNKILRIAASALIGMSMTGVAQAAGWTNFDFVSQVSVGSASVRVQLENHQNVASCPKGTWYVLGESSQISSEKILAMALLAKTTDQQIRVYSDSCIFGYNKIKHIQIK